MPVGRLQIRQSCGLTGELTPLASLKGGRPLLARVPTNRGGVYFCATTPDAGDSSLPTNGVVLYVLVQRALAAGAAVLGKTRQLIAGEAALEQPTTWQQVAGGPRRALDRLRPSCRSLSGRRPAAGRQPRGRPRIRPPVLADDRVAELFQGLDFARVDDRAGSLAGLIQEIWRLFLVAMMIAMLVEAALCLPRRVSERSEAIRRASAFCDDRRGIGPSKTAWMPIQGKGRSGSMRLSTVNSTHTLTFLWTPWSVALSIGVVLLTAGFCFVAWRRSGYARSMGLLELLRLALVALMALLLNQPEWIEEFRPEEKPAIAVLWDASTSMDTRDVPLGSGARLGADLAARGDRSADRRGHLDTLRERMNVVIQPFSAPGPGHGTDLYEPLAQAPEKIQEPARHRADLGRRLERGPAAGAGGDAAAHQGRARCSPCRWAAAPGCPTSSS